MCSQSTFSVESFKEKNLHDRLPFEIVMEGAYSTALPTEKKVGQSER